MDSSILLGASALFAVLFALYSVLRARRNNEPIGFLERVLAIIATTVLVLTLVFDNIVEAAFGRVELTVIGYVAVVAGLGWWISRRSAAQQGQTPNQARGRLSFWVSLLVIIAAFAIPFYAQSVPDVSAQQQVAIPTPINAESPFADSIVALDVAPTQTPVELSNTIPTPEMPGVFFTTPTPMPENISVCEGTITTNLNVRSYPAVAQGNIVTVFAEDSPVAVVGRNSETNWLFVTGEGDEGWVSADFVETDEECGEIPLRQWRVQ